MATETEVRTEVDRIIELVNDSHEKAKAKGGTTSTPYLLANLPNAIESIPSGEDVTAETNAYTTELAELTTAVTALEEELAGKAAGGGGAVETCTVTITCESGSVGGYLFTILEDGEVSNAYLDDASESMDMVSINNVVCGSSFYVQIIGLSMIGNSLGGGIELFGVFTTGVNRAYRAPIEANATGTITIYDND